METWKQRARQLKAINLRFTKGWMKEMWRKLLACGRSKLTVCSTKF